MQLEGLRVVEIASLIAGPFCGLTLADLGADVIKVEPPGGEESRRFPPFTDDGESGFFHALNRGKRGVELSLSDPRLRELVASADVVVENLGANRSRLGERGEKQIWCAVSGLGADRATRTMDPSLQATMGLMALTGEPDGRPGRVPVPLIDFMTGMYASQHVLLALMRGEGAFLDCALFDSVATLTSSAALLSLGGYIDPRRMGSQSYLAVPSKLYETSDGQWLQVVALHNRHWEALCDALGHPEWCQDERFATVAKRIEHREAVNELVSAVIATASADEWVERINGAGGMCERVREIEEAWADPLLEERGLVGRLEDDVLGFQLPLVSMARTADPAALRRGPGLGEHNDAILD
jgi:crotonobetainyl-CoA:carnitine CoA-transferase CaiB-like acyl-CoA transferase